MSLVVEVQEAGSHVVEAVSGLMVGSNMFVKEHIQSIEWCYALHEQLGCHGQQVGMVVALEQSGGAEEDEAMGAYLVIPRGDTSQVISLATADTLARHLLLWCLTS